MLKISSALINARMDTSDREVARPFEGPGTVASGLAGIKNGMVMSLYFMFEKEYTKIFKYTNV